MKNIITSFFASAWLRWYKIKKIVLIACSLLIFLTIAVSANAFSNPVRGGGHRYLAAEIHITGRVTDKENAPLPAVTIVVIMETILRF